MIEQTMLFADTLSQPKYVDLNSCDFSFPLAQRSDLFDDTDTSSIRDCYRSKRIKLSQVTHKNKAITVFLHNASELLGGAVRVTLWQDYADCAATGTLVGTVVYDSKTQTVPKEVYYEAVCVTRSLVQGVAVGTFVVNGTFAAMTVTVLQPCTGITVHVIDPELSANTAIPTIGLKRA